MKAVLYVLGALVWSAVVFAATFWLTFPSETLINRLRYEVPRRMGEEYSAEIGSLRPWWVGLSADDVKLYRSPPQVSTPVGDESEEPPPAEAGGPELVALLKNVSLRVSPWSLVRRAPYVRGSLGMTEGELDFAVGTGVDKRGEATVTDFSAHGSDLPMADLMAMAGAGGDGKLSIDADLHAGESGTLRDGDGKITIKGANLTLTDLELPMVGPLGMSVPISNLSIVTDLAAGKGTITEGTIQSDLGTIAITGDITMREPFSRSAFTAEVTVSNLSDQLASFEPLMASAKQADGTYAYTCRGIGSRLESASCTPKGTARFSSRAPGVRPGGVSPVMGAGVGGAESPTPMTDEEREKHREEIRQRLRERREQREAERAGGPEMLEPQTDGEEQAPPEEVDENGQVPDPSGPDEDPNPE